MRPILFVALVCALVLTGCGGQQPTATAVPPTVTVQPTTGVVSQGDNALATLAATVGAAQPGTLVIPDQQTTPNAPTAVPIVINTLTFTQSGGIAAISQTTELHGDGTLIRDGQSSTVSQENVKKIASMLDGVNFFNLRGIFVSPAGTADAYRYSLSVDASAGSRTITSMDGMTPQPLADIYDAIRALGNS